MIRANQLLADLKRATADLVDDLRTRTDEVDDVRGHVQALHDNARAAGRTNHTYEEWREDLLAQVTVGWVLATVFVRFSEDNRLSGTPLLSGPDRDRRELAGDHRAKWLAAHPEAGDREWLEEVFRRYRELPAAAGIFGPHNPLWQFGPSADGARTLVELWRCIDPATGELRHDFTDPDLDTRFLGDLYQDLSEHAKKTYALLQTPEFVEEFILDRTLDPAIKTFGLEQVRMIDPTCGSGHFLLGAFERILRRWEEKEPGTPIRDLVQRTLDAVNGVDLNPFAVGIARFRLLVSALKAARIKELADAPAFRINVATGDSLLHGRRSGSLFSGADELGPLIKHRYPTEDEDLANHLLEPGQYHAVVGNPPYVNVRDPALATAYRALYETCYRQYSLGVPFTERFFNLAVTAANGSDAGFVGLITTNTFMKREFGVKLVEDWLPRRDLTHIIDTSGAYIPGHGTPTVILFGKHQRPQANTIRTVLGIRGEPARPSQPAEGKVWTSIVNLVDRPGRENDFVSVADTARDRFTRHPWSLEGGAAPDVLLMLECAGGQTIDSVAALVGYTGQTNADSVFLASQGAHTRNGVEPDLVRGLVRGEMVRDWILALNEETLFPYDMATQRLIVPAKRRGFLKRVWSYRQMLGSRRTFSKQSYFKEGRPWWEWHQVALDRVPGFCISFAFVATHNHFVLDRGGKVFNRSAPVIKLPDGATEEDHLELLGLLNSSVACFWMKQVFHNKGSTVDQRGARQTTIAFENFYEFDGTKLKQFPIPGDTPLERSRDFDDLAQRVPATLPAQVLERVAPSREALRTARECADMLRTRMVALQEELDWECYHIYGLTEEELSVPSDQVPNLKKGERAFEIVLARKMASGEAESTWFVRHGSTPITELPTHWPDAYRRLVERRIALIESDRSIGLLERPEYKRRWNWEEWEDLEREAVRSWLLDRLEDKDLWAQPLLTTTARLADRVRRDASFLEAIHIFTRRTDVDVADVVRSLVTDQAVPFAIGYRFTPSGLRRRREWEKVWELQRMEDAIDARTKLPADHPDHMNAGDAAAEKERLGLDRIPVPPKYRSSDYVDSKNWRLRGKLDVPQERFILYPGTRLGADTSPVIGWAGWDHLARARALASHYTARKDEGAEAKALVCLLAGLEELVPWLKQWHNEIDPEFGQRMGEFFASFVETEARSLSRTVNDLASWTPA